MQLLVATLNPGKVKEFHDFLGDLPLEVLGLASLPSIESCQEDGETFEQNACKKALHYSRHTPAFTIADDSGLVVDALGGEPGVYSARYLGKDSTDEQRYLSILKRSQPVPEPLRSARFVCCIALAREGEILQTFPGEVEGRIALQAQGSNGFGYDPIFYLPDLGKTMAELNPEEKLRISHRGKALRELQKYFQAHLI
jgi:XTP/dITP diphosphohydrolase